MAIRRSARSLRQEYQQYVEREVEDYKVSVPASVLYGIAAEAARILDEAPQLGMREVLLSDEVDRIIGARLRIPSFETWRRRREKNANELRRPEHWGLRHDTPLAQAIPHGGPTPAVVVAGARLEGSALYLAANGCEVTAIEPEQAVVNRVLRAAQDAGLTERLRGFAADLVSYTPDGPLAAVICTPAAFAGLSAFEREQVFRLLQQATTDGGVHLIETLIAGQQVLTEEELRSRYRGWQISLVPEPGASQTFVAKKPLM
ncbi:MAG: hypothetical protein K1X31_02590 [Gemmatimonadaceae bacterium]|nr:hypothetical protein [Gemmatimonadaceae bacterium]